MKAIVFAHTGGPEVLAQADVPKPEARAGWVLIKNHAIGVNFADTRFRQGTYTVKPKLPDTPGMKDAGADAVINYVKDKFADEVLRLTGDRGVDLILDAVGKPTFEEGLRCLAAFGHIVTYGRAGGAPDPLTISALSPKSQKVSAFSLPTLTRGFPDKTRESAEQCFALMREGRLKLHVAKTFPLAQAAEAHRYLESRQSTGKLILIP